MKWYNPQCEPFVLSGFAFYKQDMVYRRLPLSPSRELPEAVYYWHGDETAGGQIRFHAHIKTLQIEVSLSARDRGESPFVAYGIRSGFDFYASINGGDFEFIGMATQSGLPGRNGHYQITDRIYRHKFLELQEAVDIDILLNFPLLGAVDKVLIGVDDDAVISAPQKRFRDEKNIVIYGGSIQQGVSASRPGMVDSNILSRWLNREVFNMGFNGSAKAEPEVAHVFAEIENTAALVISTEGNCPDGAWLEEHLPEFIKIYRRKYPAVPIILMPFGKNGRHDIDPKRNLEKQDKYDAQIKVYEQCKADGDENIYLLDQNAYVEQFFDGHSVWHEFYSDGMHKTDMAYYASAKGLYDLIKKLEKEGKM